MIPAITIAMAEEFLTEAQALEKIPRRRSVAREWLRTNVPIRELDLYLLTEIRAAMIKTPPPPDAAPKVKKTRTPFPRSSVV